MRANEFVQEYTVKQNSRFLRLGMSPDGVYTARILTPAGEREIQDRDLKRLEQTVKLKYNLELPAGYRLGEEQQLDELDFMGMSQCTKDCSGHRAGYAWSKQRGGAHAASWSPSFNKGAEIAAAGY